ncbi:hypothetical protein BOTBODRAFT_211241 [Botryobasidium botryosum FD-172 SS1]|uniref:Protein CASP n=1 Tax=Botryobasidium botryosum (strain FD-172 SS1) TaxID=930990 RepID=A0A067ND25_BOTB1|nr:hypothetical protein BOTBODRAFT_211241 [Botryobasidium botryosum FD-172 SS1]
MATADRNFSDALSTWKDINLAELQKTLDAQGIELVENQKEGLVSRKALADRTREFKKIPDDEKLNAFKGLLKSYQTEIDNLTRRSKISESAFLSVYKLLAEAPDPYPLLDAAIDQAVKVEEARLLQSELQRLREDNAELRRRVADVAALEAAKKKSDARVEILEEKMDALIQEKVSQKENELNATYDERMMNYEERERDLQRQVTLAKQQLRDLQNSHESNQAKLMDQSQRQDQETVAKLAEMEMVLADLDRANSRVAAVERRNEILRAEIEAVRSGSDNTDRMKGLEAQITELESEAERLSRAFEAQRDATLIAESALKHRTEEFEKELASQSGEVDALRNKLRQLNDYDEIKRELEIMKFVEFSGGDVDDDDGEGGGLQLPDPNADKANQQPGKSLESLLMAKNKRILEELTKFRILHGELESSLQAVTEQLARDQKELEQQKGLNERLENDLLQLNRHIPKTNGDGISGTSTPSGQPGAQDGLAGLNLGQRSTDTSRKSGALTFAPSADTSILPIVTSQRDRFRQRNAELEEELRKQFEIMSDLRGEIKSLQVDNLKLYEKIRYMQSYRNEAAAAGSGPSSSIRANASAPPASLTRHDEMGKYRSMYEERMNPFEAFRGREAARAVQALNPIEKVVFVLTRTILANRRARMVFIFYAVCLHLLVMFMSYECTSGGSGHPVIEPPPFG